MLNRFLLGFVLLFSLVMVSAQDDDTYTIELGDALREVAEELSVNLACLMDANDIANPSLITPGDVLDIPIECVMATGEALPLGETTATVDTTTETAETSGQGGGMVLEAGTFTVSSGDTLARIANAYGTTVACIASANNIADTDLIYAGQVLTISEDCVGIAAGQGGGGGEDIICRGDRNPGRETINGVYVVQSGDMLDFIGCDFGLQTSCLAEVNNLNPPGAIELGQALIIDFSCPAWDGPPGPGDLED